MAEALLGTSVRRREDRRVLLGATQFVDDLRLPNMTFVGILRSPYPHAKLRHIDLTQAVRIRNVVRALRGSDIVRQVRPLPLFVAPKGVRTRPIYPLAVARVRYVGEPVAAIVATDPYTAADGVDAIRAEFEPLQAVVDAEAALGADAPRLFEDWPDNVAWTWSARAGDVDAALRQAPHVVARRFHVHRQYGAPLEPRGTVAAPTPAGGLHVWSATQWPHFVRSMLAHVLRMRETLIRVTAPDVGGGFGTKQDVYPEEILVAFLARALGRPVKWVATRREDIQASSHAREQMHDLELGLDRQGRILALRDRFVADVGALHAMSIGPQQLAAVTLTGPYRVPVCEVRVRCVVTNKTPSGAYRGYGQPKSTFVVERALDIAAAELRIDPAEIRLRNFIGPREFPYRTPLGLVYDSGDYPACLRQGLEAMGYAEFRRHQIAARQRGRYLGMGISFYVESAGFGPTRQVRARGCIYDGSETARLRPLPDGSIELSTGLSPHGQGAGTVLAQIVAAELGLPLERVHIICGDTATSPRGWGTFGSRDAAVGGVAALLAARQLKARLLHRAAKVLHAPAHRLALRNGTVVDRQSGRQLPWAALVGRAANGRSLIATATYDPSGFTFSYGVHLAVAEVDTETGRVSIPRFLVVHDCGRMLNPMLVEGQIHGGVAQGLGSALYERIHYDAGAQLLTQTLTEYAMPPATELPSIEVGHRETPTPLNPLGAKGMAEGGSIAPPAAVANAVADALGGTTQNLTELPIGMAAVRELTVSLGLSRG